jgi:hypothetical protein
VVRHFYCTAPVIAPLPPLLPLVVLLFRLLLLLLLVLLSWVLGALRSRCHRSQVKVLLRTIPQSVSYLGILGACG